MQRNGVRGTPLAKGARSGALSSCLISSRIRNRLLAENHHSGGTGPPESRESAIIVSRGVLVTYCWQIGYSDHHPPSDDGILPAMFLA